MIDFKTDEPGGIPVLDTYPAYARQLATYAESVGARRSGLLIHGHRAARWLT